MDWIDLAQNRAKWRAVVNTVTKLRGSIKYVGFLDWLRTHLLLKMGCAAVSSHGCWTRFSGRIQCWIIKRLPDSLVADTTSQPDRQTDTFFFYFQGIPASIISKLSRVPICYLRKLNIKIQRTIILPVVLCGCKTWSVTLRENTGWRIYNPAVLFTARYDLTL